MILNQAGPCFCLELAIDLSQPPAGKACTGRKLRRGCVTYLARSPPCAWVVGCNPFEKVGLHLTSARARYPKSKASLDLSWLANLNISSHKISPTGIHYHFLIGRTAEKSSYAPIVAHHQRVGRLSMQGWRWIKIKFRWKIWSASYGKKLVRVEDARFTMYISAYAHATQRNCTNRPSLIYKELDVLCLNLVLDLMWMG